MKTWQEKKINPLAPKVYRTWEPIFISEGGRNYLHLNTGTVNGFLPTNWKDKFLIPQDLSYIKLKVESNSGQIESVTIVVNGSDSDIGQKPGFNLPPSSFIILLGVYNKGKYYMIYDNPIFCATIISYILPKETVEIGRDPYDKYFIWECR